jgi:hypothetical protein
MTGTERHHDIDEERLARLYCEQGDIEPGPGVDQRIRSNARDQVRPGSLPRPAHWLGGVAVAASLFVVVSVVINIEPPEAELPAGELNRSSRSGEAGEADRAGTSDFVPASRPRVEKRARPEPAMDQAMPVLSAPPPEPTMERRLRDSAADDAERTAREQFEALGESRSVEADKARAREALQSAGETELLEEEAGGAQGALWLIDRLISAGNAQGARAEVEAFRRQYPERAIPPALLDRLEALEGEARQD